MILKELVFASDEPETLLSLTKQHDVLVQTQWGGWPLKTFPSPYVLPRHVLSLYVKVYRHNYGRTRYYPPLDMRGVSDLYKPARPPPWRIW